jgi:hypothetical protein
MADEKTEVVDDAGDKDFAEGFIATEATPVAPPKTDDTPVVTDPPAPVADAAPKDVAPPAGPKYVQITKAQFDAFEAAAAKVGDFDKKFDKAFGSMGSLQDVVKQLQSSTPKGEAVQLTDEMFAEMAEDYPDLAKHQRAILERVLKGAVGTGTQTASVGPAEVNRLVAEGVKTAQIEALEDEYPDWRAIVGAVDSPEKADPNNAFRKWLSGEPAAYAAKVTATHNASVLAKAIAKFKDAAKALPPPPKKDAAPNPKDVARKGRIEAAVQPKGDGNSPPPPKTADDEFEAGFRSG